MMPPAVAVKGLITEPGMKEPTHPTHKKVTEYCFFHDLIVRPEPYRGHDSLVKVDKELSDQHFQYTNPKTSFYLCKKYSSSQEFQKLPRFLIKRLAYRKENSHDRWGRVIYNDSESKNIDQVSTEFHCLTLLKGSHRAIQMEAFIHENVRLKEDKRFFYHNLKLPDRRSKGIRNVCFILEEMNSGSLTEQLTKVIRDKEPFKEEKIVEFACQFAEGLLQLRAKGIIHRDLRPDNVLVHNGQLKFADFDSAFIKGYSNYRNIKNGVDMKETTPLEIMLLIAESEEKLKNLTSEELYAKQEKADIYYLGVNIYSMVFSKQYESFNGGQVLRNLIGIKKRSGFCGKLLDLMARCLEKDVHVRIEMQEVIKILGSIEREFYFKSSSYKRVYLGVEPLNLHSFSSNQIEDRIRPELFLDEVDNGNNRKEMDQTIDEAIRLATLERNTYLFEHLFKKSIEDIPDKQIWEESHKQKLVKLNEDTLLLKIEKYLERLQIKAYYYELAYRILCEVNLAEVRSSLHFEHLRTHIELFSSELVVILTFIYDTILKCSFTSDPNFVEQNPAYELRRVYENIKIMHSRWEFFSGRLKLQKEARRLNQERQEKTEEVKNNQREKESGGSQRELPRHSEKHQTVLQGMQIVESLSKMVETLKSKKYESHDERLSFLCQQKTILKYLDKIEQIVKQEMIQTIISLILAYEKIKTEPWGFRCNLKNAIFMLMILETQNTKTVQKNDMVIIKEELTTMISMNLGWRSEELEAFFNNYTLIHSEEVMKGLVELESQAIIASEKTVVDQDFYIRINAPDKEEEALVQEHEKKEEPKEQKGAKQREESNEEYKEKEEREENSQYKERKYKERQADEEDLNRMSNSSFAFSHASQNLLDKSQMPSDKVVEVSQIVDDKIGDVARQSFDFKLYTAEIEDIPVIENGVTRPRSKGMVIENYD